MGTQDAPLSSYIGTFQNTKEVIINGGHFQAINPHDTINRESNTDSMSAPGLVLCIRRYGQRPTNPHT